MAVEQQIRFVLNLSLAESYIYGTAIMSDKCYSINIQQATDDLVVLPADFSDIEWSSKALVSFGLSMASYSNKITIISEIKVGPGDLIEVYLNQDNILLALANNLPLELTLQTKPVSM
ncbi:MAG: hypothetical protein WAL66_17805 [Nitrososphaeraceae archaeon]